MASIHRASRDRARNRRNFPRHHAANPAPPIQVRLCADEALMNRQACSFRQGNDAADHFAVYCHVNGFPAKARSSAIRLRVIPRMHGTACLHTAHKGGAHPDCRLAMRCNHIGQSCSDMERPVRRGKFVRGTFSPAGVLIQLPTIPPSCHPAIQPRPHTRSDANLVIPLLVLVVARNVPGTRFVTWQPCGQGPFDQIDQATLNHSV